MEKKSINLGQTSDSPIAELNCSSTRLHGSHGREERSMYSIGSLVVSFDLREFLEVVSDSPPESIVLVLTREQRFKVVQLFS